MKFFFLIKRLFKVLFNFFLECNTPHVVRLIFYTNRRIEGNTHMEPSNTRSKHEMLWLYLTQ